MHIIGLCGFAGSGKSTAANFLVREHGFTRLSFATAVKDITAILFGWDRERLNGTTPQDRLWREEPDLFWSARMQRPWTPRIALQFVGTDLCRQHVHENIWAEQVVAQIRRLGPTAKVIIDDVRFVNEIQTLRGIGAHLLIVHRQYDGNTIFPTAEHALLWEQAPILPSSIPLHPSEWNWLQIADIKTMPYIINDGSYDTFFAKLNMWYTTSVLNSSFLEVTTV